MLRDMVQTSKTAAELGDLLTMVGFELEEVYESEGEDCLDVNIMANRGDGASVLGMAREVLAKDLTASPTPLWQRLMARESSHEELGAKVTVETENCTRYAARIIDQVENGPSPDWLQKRLRQCGQRPISLLVDLTNYVMLETGQPLHAFDLDRLNGGEIVVRQAKAGETIRTLDGKDHELDPSMMMICDGLRPVAVAGVMGGEETEVGHGTTTCLLESAHFAALSVRRTRKQLGLQTEASYRFERHVDPEGVTVALDRFVELYEEITGKPARPGITDVRQAAVAPTGIRLDLGRCRRLLGMEVSLDDAAGILKRLGFQVALGQDQLTASAPSWRADIQREEDLIEEVGRVFGYDKIPSILPVGSTTKGGLRGFDLAVEGFVQSCLRCGLDQAISHTLDDLHSLDRDVERVRVRTPHSPDMALLRSSMLPCLADSAQRNRGQAVRLFEVGKAFAVGSEKMMAGILLAGPQRGVHWAELQPQASFWVLKGILEGILRGFGAGADSVDPRFHPARQAKILVEGKEVGVFGQLHPDIAEDLDLPEAYAAEIDLADALAGVDLSFHSRPISRNPAARRDIAVTAPKSLAYSQIESAIQVSGGEELERHWLFDVYEGKGIPEGSHSLAIALQFRRVGSNFTDEEANQARDRVVAALAGLGATLR